MSEFHKSCSTILWAQRTSTSGWRVPPAFGASSAVNSTLEAGAVKGTIVGRLRVVWQHILTALAHVRPYTPFPESPQTSSSQKKSWHRSEKTHWSEKVIFFFWSPAGPQHAMCRPSATLHTLGWQGIGVGSQYHKWRHLSCLWIWLI